MASTMSCFEWFLIGFILILPFLYEKSSVVRYYLKFTLYYAYVWLVCALLIPIVACYPRDVTNLVMASRLCRYASYFVGITWELRGLEHWDSEKPAIVVSNHQSSLDILGMFELWPIMRRCTVIAKRSLLYAGPFGLGAWLSGLIFIDRMRTTIARDQLREATDKIIRQKVKLWIFPEGTRSNRGTLQPFKKGAFYQAIDAQIPILPVVFSQYYFLDDMTKSFESGKIIITTLPPVPTKGMTRDDLDDLSAKVRDSMMLVYQETSKDLLNQNKIAI